MIPRTQRQVQLAARPVGFPKESDFRIVEGPVPSAGPGEILVRTVYLSLDPYMRGRMSDARSYVPPVTLGDVMEGGTVGEVVRSNHPGFAAGDVVEGRLGWQEYAVSAGKGVRKIDPTLAPISTALGVLGMPGLTAYFGLLEVGQPKPGETVVVSAASGAVGGLVGQIAKLRGCRAVGLAGSDAKVNYITRELGYDAGINYRTAADLDAALQAACPNGVDVYFDNVGGRITEAVSRHVNTFARFAICGAHLPVQPDGAGTRCAQRAVRSHEPRADPGLHRVRFRRPLQGRPGPTGGMGARGEAQVSRGRRGRAGVGPRSAYRPPAGEELREDARPRRTGARECPRPASLRRRPGAPVITRPFGPTGVPVAVVGQGTWRMGEDAARRREEVAALRVGIELGMTHIDTAEMYGDGGSERLVAEAIAGQRDRVFLASKVLPENASRAGTIRACEHRCRRLRTDHLDLYLLHWWSERHRIEETMEAMSELVGRGLTRLVGVSNLDVGRCAAPRPPWETCRWPRIRCSITSAIGRSRKTSCRTASGSGWPSSGYTPLARGGFMKEPMTAIARRYERTPRQVALNFLTRRPLLFAIPKASHPEHVRENAGALDFTLTPAEVRAIDGAT